MSVSILEALQNADYNLRKNVPPSLKVWLFAAELATNRLHNATELLLKGYPLETRVDPLLEKYGLVENVPIYSPSEEEK